MDASLSIAKPSNFRFAFSFLPQKKREAIRCIYEFCRHTDDLVDLNQNGDANVQLAQWRNEIERCYSGTTSNPLLLRLGQVISEFRIPKSYLLELVDGVEMDLTHTRYETFDELKGYCYRVASIVGLISMEIFGYTHEATREYAIQLGYALQLTNILRDVASDAAMGRIYLPLEDLKRCEYTEEELLASVYNDRFISLMEYEAGRAREYYTRTHALLERDERATMFPAEIMHGIYSQLLHKMEHGRFDVFRRHYALSSAEKFAIAMKYWLRSIV
jgi:phytoene synthase